MSEIINAQPVWAPPEFPVKGRLKLSRAQMEANYLLRKKEEKAFKIEVNTQHQARIGSTCCKTLHISFFFDGTNNNKQNDLKNAKPPHPTNIARLFEATYDDQNEKAKKEREYFKYYMPGVGTAFPEIGEYNFSSNGLTFATGGEDRINWALLMLVNSLYLSAGETELPNDTLRSSLKKMSTLWPFDGQNSRQQEIKKLLLKEDIAKKLSEKPKALAIKLFVYGFSRGAAEARAFIHWVAQLFDLDTPENTTIPKQTLASIPLHIEFLGILDTVPSVGIVHLVPAFTGHFDWANETQQLPDEKQYPNFIRQCRHFVAAHEQRLCFPLDTVRRPQIKDGFSKGHRAYPRNTLEVVYPGMHSDVGGGYPKNDQGKSPEGDDYILSQIVLHDMYAVAFSAGAPLCTLVTDVPKRISGKPMVYTMEPETAELFEINPKLVARFNAWRSVTLALKNNGNAKVEYEPEKLGKPLENIIETQMAWMTAWRIDRYAKGHYFHQPFYKNAEEWSKEHQSPTQKSIETEKNNSEALQKQKAALQKKAKAMGKEGISAPITDDNGQIITYEVENNGKKEIRPVDFSFDNLAGPPIFESKRDQTQLSEAATEFRHDYEGKIRQHTSVFDFPVDTLFKYTMYLLNSDDERLEYQRIKDSGDAIYKEGQGFPAKMSSESFLACSLFDDQIHDSRAWFMHFELGTREPWAGYFRYRMIYSGNETNKSLSPIALAGQLIGVATLVGGAIYTVKQRDIKGVLGGIAGTMGALSLEYEVIDIATGLTIPFIDNAAELLQPTNDPSSVFAVTQAQTAYNYSQGIIDTLSQSIDPSKLLKVG